MSDELLRRLCVALAAQDADPVAREMAREVLAGRMRLTAAPGSLAYRELFHQAFSSVRDILDRATPDEIAAAAERDRRACDNLATDLPSPPSTARTTTT